MARLSYYAAQWPAQALPQIASENNVLDKDVLICKFAKKIRTSQINSISMALISLLDFTLRGLQVTLQLILVVLTGLYLQNNQQRNVAPCPDTDGPSLTEGSLD